MTTLCLVFWIFRFNFSFFHKYLWKWCVTKKWWEFPKWHQNVVWCALCCEAFGFHGREKKTNFFPIFYCPFPNVEYFWFFHSSFRSPLSFCAAQHDIWDLNGWRWESLHMNKLLWGIYFVASSDFSRGERGHACKGRYKALECWRKPQGCSTIPNRRKLSWRIKAKFIQIEIFAPK